MGQTIACDLYDSANSELKPYYFLQPYLKGDTCTVVQVDWIWPARVFPGLYFLLSRLYAMLMENLHFSNTNSCDDADLCILGWVFLFGWIFVFVLSLFLKFYFPLFYLLSLLLRAVLGS